jgi:phosphoribosylformylglycinamidine (FGAM) synthase-like enzyme
LRCCSARPPVATASVACRCWRPPAFDDEGTEATKRPSVQVGDPFEEKRLIEACLELLDRNLAVGVQDLGGAGITCATSETAAKGGAGMDVYVRARCPAREPGMEPFELMTSESQERMLAIVEPEHLDEVLEIVRRRWEIRATRGRHGHRHRAPAHLRTARRRGPGRCAGQVARGGRTALRPAACRTGRPGRAALGERERASRAHRCGSRPGRIARRHVLGIVSQYDHQLFLNTVEGPGGDATVLRLKHPTTGTDTGRGLALSCDGNHHWCAIDPRVGGAATVAESVMNLATVGARPVAMVNCLNFGNPEHPEVMWQLSEAVDGLADACRALSIPVVGGNVSLYNESRGTDIDPTPIITVLGVVDELTRRPPGVRLVEGGRLIMLGETVRELSGSMWARRRGHRRGTLPAVDIDAVARVAGVLRQLVNDGLVLGAHDVSTGGLGAAIAEMAIASGVGARIARVDDHVDLFSESAGRAVVCVAVDQVREVLDVCEAAGVPATKLGAAMDDRLVVKDLIDVALSDLTRIWRDRLPTQLGAGTTQG